MQVVGLPAAFYRAAQLGVVGLGPMAERRLEQLRVWRAHGFASFPADFMLVGAMNPCPCGFYGDRVKPCTCSAMAISRYQKRISGPLLDRIDLFVEAPRVEYEKLTDERNRGRCA